MEMNKYVICMLALFEAEEKSKEFGSIVWEIRDNHTNTYIGNRMTYADVLSQKSSFHTDHKPNYKERANAIYKRLFDIAQKKGYLFEYCEINSLKDSYIRLQLTHMPDI